MSGWSARALQCREPPTATGPAGHSAERREHILTTARRLWGQHGYHTVSLRRIAEESGVALSLIDHHFGAKHLLFAQSVVLLSEACERARRELVESPQDPSASRFEQLAAALLVPAWHVHQTASRRGLLRLWLCHRHDTLPEVRLPLDRAVLPLVNAVAEAARRGEARAPCPHAQTTCRMVFANGVEWLTAQHPNPDYASSLGFDQILTRMAASLRVGLAEPA